LLYFQPLFSLPASDAPHEGNQTSTIQPVVKYMPAAPKIGSQSGHPDKNEMDTLDGLFRLSYKQGYSTGWTRGDAEKQKGALDMDSSSSTADAGPTQDDVVDQIAESVTDPPSVEDGGKMTAGSMTSAAMVTVVSDMNGGAPARDNPLPPDDPLEHATANQVHDAEAENGFTGSSPMGSLQTGGDYVKFKTRVPTRNDPRRMTPAQIIALTDAEIGPPDTASLCAMDPTYCTRRQRESEFQLTAAGYWEPGMTRDAEDDEAE
jgi:hypothetical protein